MVGLVTIPSVERFRAPWLSLCQACRSQLLFFAVSEMSITDPMCAAGLCMGDFTHDIGRQFFVAINVKVFAKSFT